MKKKQQQLHENNVKCQQLTMLFFGSIESELEITNEKDFEESSEETVHVHDESDSDEEPVKNFCVIGSSRINHNFYALAFHSLTEHQDVVSETA